MSTAAVRRYTVEEYLALERDSETKHEFYDGEIFAMAGASVPHNLVAGNVVTSLNSALRDRDCLVFPSDMRVLCPTGLYTYPDASVVCGPRHIEKIGGLDTLKNPLTIIEVLSKSTEPFDRGRQFDHYKTIRSLRGYFLLWQDGPRADHFGRTDDGRWVLTSVTGLEAAIAIPELGLTLSLADVYMKVEFPPPEDETKTTAAEYDSEPHPRGPKR
jgi:Uma2 family endonuclease